MARWISLLLVVGELMPKYLSVSRKWLVEMGGVRIEELATSCCDALFGNLDLLNDAV